jgi:CRP-like cAMP-binding protein
MSLEADMEILRAIPFFEGFPEEHLRLLAFSAEPRSLPEKLLLYDEGQLLHSAYVVVSGVLTGERKGKAGETPRKREIGPGRILGERALILDTAASEAVRVLTRARVLQVRKTMFRRLLQEYPQTAIALRARLARNVMRQSAEFRDVARRMRAAEF